MSVFEPSKAKGSFAHQGSQALPVHDDGPSSSSNQFTPSSSNQFTSSPSPHPNVSSNFTSNDISLSPKRKVASLGISGRSNGSSKKRKMDDSRTDNNPQLDSLVGVLDRVCDAIGKPAGSPETMAAEQLAARYEESKASGGHMTAETAFRLLTQFAAQNKAAVYIGLQGSSDLRQLFEEHYGAL
jgi:hypothetical protein